MRNLPFLIICSILVACGIVSHAQTNTQQESNIEAQDSIIEVIGYYSKNDTLIYWINESNWRLSPTDTIKTAGVSTKVRLTVVDSTSTGYKMDYTFLEVIGDSTGFSSQDNYQTTLNKLVEKLSKKIVGTTIHFETDEFGAITKYNNLDQIKRQVKSLFKESMKEVMQMPEIVGLKKEFNVDIKEIVKNVDTDKLIEGYLKELKLLFLCHGNLYKVGQSHTHEDETATTYENDTYSDVTFDSSDYTYSVTIGVVNIIPQSTLKDMIGSLVELMDNESITESFNKGFDKDVSENAIHESYFSSDYLAQGWPYRITNQSTLTVDGHGKSKQTYIYLDYVNY